MEQASKSINTLYILWLLKDFSAFVFKKWILVAAIIILAATLGVVFVWLQKPKYIAEMTFALEESSGGGTGGYANLASQLGFNIGGTSSGMFKGDNLMELMKSRYILEKTLFTTVDVDGKKQLLVNMYLDLTGKGKEYVSKGLLPAHFFSATQQNTLTQDSLLYITQKDVGAKLLRIDRVDKKLSIVSVSIQFHDQVFAKVFCEKLVENVLQFYVQTMTKKELHNVTVLQNQADSLKRLMSGAMGAAALSNDLNVNPARQILRVNSQRNQLDANVFGIAYGEILKNLELAKITLRRETPLIQVIDTPKLPLQNMKSGRLSGLISGVTIAALILLPLLIVLYHISSAKRKSDYLVQQQSSAAWEQSVA